MAEPTIKKTLKVKTVRTVLPPDAAGGAETATDEAASQATGEATSPVTAQAAFVAPKRPSYTVFAILALIATVAFIVLVALQWMEWTYYSPAFPKPMQAGPVGS